MTMFVVALSNDDPVAARRFLAGLQQYHKVAFPTGQSDGVKFATAQVDFVYLTDPTGKCLAHEISDHELLRKIAKQHDERNPGICEKLNLIANALEETYQSSAVT